MAVTVKQRTVGSGVDKEDERLTRRGFGFFKKNNDARAGRGGGRWAVVVTQRANGCDSEASQ